MRVFDGIIMGGLMGHRYYPDTAASHIPHPPHIRHSGHGRLSVFQMRCEITVFDLSRMTLSEFMVTT